MDEESLHKAFTDSKPVDIQLNVHNCRNSNIDIFHCGVSVSMGNKVIHDEAVCCY